MKQIMHILIFVAMFTCGAILADSWQISAGWVMAFGHLWIPFSFLLADFSTGRRRLIMRKEVDRG